MGPGIKVMERFDASYVNTGFLKGKKKSFRHGRRVKDEGLLRIARLQLFYALWRKAVIKAQMGQGLRNGTTWHKVADDVQVIAPSRFKKGVDILLKGRLIGLRDMKG